MLLLQVTGKILITPVTMAPTEPEPEPEPHHEPGPQPGPVAPGRRDFHVPTDSGAGGDGARWRDLLWVAAAVGLGGALIGLAGLCIGCVCVSPRSAAPVPSSAKGTHHTPA